MKKYILFLKNDTMVPGTLVPNDLIKERIWKTPERYIFEDEVKQVYESENNQS